MKTTLQALKITILALILSVGVSYVSADWSNPTQAPTGGNVAAPVNVGSAEQDKDGVLGVGGLGVFGDANISGDASISGSASFFGNFLLQDGTQGAGKILVSDTDGNTSWQAPSQVDGVGPAPGPAPGPDTGSVLGGFIFYSGQVPGGRSTSGCRDAWGVGSCNWNWATRACSKGTLTLVGLGDHGLVTNYSYLCIVR